MNFDAFATVIAFSAFLAGAWIIFRGRVRTRSTPRGARIPPHQRGDTNVRTLGKIGAGALALAAPIVGYYEGMIPHTYTDPVGIPTICIGHTGADVVPGHVATPGECEALLQADLGGAYGDVRRCIGVPLQPHEAAALTSFTFNVGGAALCTSTLARMANAGAPAAQWCPQLERWVYARKAGVLIQLPGLVKRRAAERAMCEGREWHGAIVRHVEGVAHVAA